MSTHDPHEDLTTHCVGEGENGGLCDTKLTYEDHFIGLRRKQGFAQRGLGLRCPECGEVEIVCPVCHDDGYFIGETTNTKLYCHNCNQRAAARQSREPFF